MKFSEAKQGRIFVIRLEHGDILHEEIERFCSEKDIFGAALIAVGGADKKSNLVVGPKDGEKIPVDPMHFIFDAPREITGTGTMFRDTDGKPMLHMHIASGREDSTVTGCVRDGIVTWHIMEIVLIELIDTTAIRDIDPILGLKLLKP